MMDEKFRDEIDAAFPKLGFTDRSTFIRDAVYKSISQLGLHIPASLKAAPSRAGKGGRQKKSPEQNIHIGGDNHGAIIQKKKSTSTLDAGHVPVQESAKPKRKRKSPEK